MNQHHFVTQKDMDKAREEFDNAFAKYNAMLTNPSDRLTIREFVHRSQLAWFEKTSKQLEQIEAMQASMKQLAMDCKAITFGLSQPRCTGTISGRYVIHKTNQCCPAHGQPAEGGRLRVSIPVTGIEAAEKAISNFEKLRELAKSVYRLEHSLNRLRGELDFVPLEPFYSTLPKELK